MLTLQSFGHRVLLGFLSLMSLLLAASASAQTGSPVMSSALQAKVADVSRLSDDIARTDRVRVMLSLATDLAPQTSDGSQAAFERIRVAARQAQDRLLAGFNAARVSEWKIQRLENGPFLDVTVTLAELEQLAGSPMVERIVPEIIVYQTLTESGPLIGTTAAYANSATGSGRMVAILDSGVDKSHVFITSGKVTEEACFSTPNASNTTLCPSGSSPQLGSGAGVNCSVSANADCKHGTHVAGIAAGLHSTGGAPPSGVARSANIMAVQVFRQPNAGGRLGASSLDINAGLDRVLTRKNSGLPIDSVNMSLGGGSFTGTCDSSDPTMTSLINSLRSAGVATVISSGNDGSVSAIGYPGCISTAITVGSTTKSDVISSFSNMSATVDVLAPGSSIRSSTPGNVFEFFNGTSMAAPHVAGAFPLIRSRLPSATVDQIENALKSTGTPVTDTRSGGTQTKPRIRVDLALNQLLGSPGQALSVSPLSNFSSSGNAGGPFSPSSTQYTVTNNGSSTLNWSVASSNTNVATVSASPAAGNLGVGASSTVTVTIPAAANSLGAGSYSSTISFTNNTNSSENTSRTVNLTVNPPGPANDNFANATVISNGQTLTGSNVGATKEVAEPNHNYEFASTGSKSVWWRYTAVASNTVTVHTCNSSFDTELAVYTGSTVSALALVASNDQASAGPCGNTNQSYLTFAATAGTVYRIVIDGYNGQTGSTSLYVSQAGAAGPANDNFSSATVISGASGSTTGSSVGATRETNEPVHYTGTSGNASVWWRWTAPSSGVMRVNLAGSSFDTVLAVYQGASVSALTQLSSNDNNGSSPQSRLTFRATAGSTYYIAVDGKTAGATGSVAMSWSLGKGATFDFDGDGTSDVLWYNSPSASVGMFRMQNLVPTWVGVGQGASGWSVVGSGDFSGDGTSDILWHNASTSAMGMYRMQNGVPTWVGIGQGATGWTVAGTGDYNGDGTTDILWYHAATSSIGMFRMSNGVPTWVGIGQGTPGWSIVGSGDFNGDGTADILWYHAASASLGMFRMSNGVPTWVGIGQGASGWTVAGIGDFNGDGTTDILWYHAASSSVGMFRMNNGVPTWVGIGQGASGWSIAGTGDYNGQGTSDILWYHSSTFTVGAFRMEGGLATWVGVGQGASGWQIAGNPALSSGVAQDVTAQLSE